MYTYTKCTANKRVISICLFLFKAGCGVWSHILKGSQISTVTASVYHQSNDIINILFSMTARKQTQQNNKGQQFHVEIFFLYKSYSPIEILIFYMRCDFKEELWTIIELTIEEISLTDRKLWSSVRAQENLSSVNDTSSSPAKYFVRLSIPLTKALKEKWRKPLCENTVM